ncbi:MAG TPA: L-seryl-tRNA(Sec) selenium transferase [Candidatus Eisenbacteria bacterium]|nr:L-seryl-tRNA(Sec) selenium transferase [Candidatus Eisenbacteria bacterium]
MTDTPRKAHPRPPSVERLIQAARERVDGRDREAVVAAAREVIGGERSRLETGALASKVDALAVELADRLEAWDGAATSALVPAINATGVLLHTNLGRARWPRAAIEAAARAAARPSLLELDRTTGARGRRFRIAEEHVIALTGAGDALFANNNAAAVALAVGLAGRGGRVAVSRGELVEIGGGVRIPEIVRRAGARLVEVGTTNRTRVEDFEAVLADGTARLVLRVHPSNFVQEGFVESPDPAAVTELAHRHGAIVVDDLGSGAFLDTAAFGLAHEVTPRERLAAGADLVTFSGDKLVGGPQVGIIAGRADLIARLRRDPLARAVRPDKVLLAAIAATLALYRAGVAARDIPVWRQLAISLDELEQRTHAVLARVTRAGEPVLQVAEIESTLGGGSLPGQTLPSRGIRVMTPSPHGLLAALRAGDPAVVGRIERDAVTLDLRAVDPDEDAGLAAALDAALAGTAGVSRSRGAAASHN